MAEVDFNTLDSAIEAASYEDAVLHGAWVNAVTGRVYEQMDTMLVGDIGAEEPDDLRGGDWLKVPTPIDLDLVWSLVVRFVEEQIPSHASAIDRLGRGRWRRFKDYLADHDLLDLWRSYEQGATLIAYEAWAEAHGLTLADVPEPYRQAAELVRAGRR